MDPIALLAASKKMRDNIGDLGTVYRTLGRGMEDVGSALTGSGGAALVDAVNSWAETAVKLPALLEEYALAVSTVAVSMATHDHNSAINYQKLGSEHHGR